jgi:hypothetical protein
VAAVAAFVAAFLLARANASSGQVGQPITPVKGAGSGLAVPHLSSSAPALPALAKPAAKPVVRRVAAPRRSPPPAALKPAPLPPVSKAKPQKPVVIVGHG